MSSRLRSSLLLAGLVLGTLPGCVDEEKLLETQAQLAEAEAALSAAETQRDQAVAERDAARAEASTATSEAESLRTALEEAQAKATALATEVDELTAAAESSALTEKVLREVELHRDELVEWIEDELLPVAEAADPKLVALREQAEAMSKQVAKLRGIPFKRPVMSRLLRREQVGEWMERDMRRDLPEEEAVAMMAVMAEFGVVPEGTDLYAIMAKFLQSGVAAFYKPQTNTFYLIDGNVGASNNPVVFHELVHAVEDQHFALDDMLRTDEENSDTFWAVKALVEGSADFFQEKYHEAFPEDVAAMNAAMQGNVELMQQQMQMMQEVPAFLIAGMGLFPYKNGSAFLRARGLDKVSIAEASDAVGALFADPPISTEQILHPERFTVDGRRDYPHVVTAPAIDGVLGEGWEEVGIDSMGELMAGMMLMHLAQPNNAMVLMGVMDPRTQGVRLAGPVGKAVDGWDGDRYTSYRHAETGEVVIVWTSMWDSAEDAQEFAATYGRILGRKITGKRPNLDVNDAGIDLTFEDPANEETATIRQSHRRVVVVLGAPAGLGEALFEAGAAVSITPDPRDDVDSAE